MPFEKEIGESLAKYFVKSNLANWEWTMFYSTHITQTKFYVNVNSEFDSKLMRVHTSW